MVMPNATHCIATDVRAAGGDGQCRSIVLLDPDPVISWCRLDVVVVAMTALVT